MVGVWAGRGSRRKEGRRQSLRHINPSVKIHEKQLVKIWFGTADLHTDQALRTANTMKAEIIFNKPQPKSKKEPLPPLTKEKSKLSEK